jgi:hypothetical protein
VNRSRFESLTLVVIGVGLAVCGMTAGVDAIVPWVFGIVDFIDVSDVWRPLYNPEPMDTFAYRPLSVVLLKVGLWITGRDATAMTAIHALILPAFALAARGFLMRHGFRSTVATAAAATSLAVPSVLFSAWICVEFDLVGATFVLAAASMLCDWRAGLPGRAWRFWLLAFVALTIKETSALQMLAYLAAFAWIHRSERPDSWGIRRGWWTVLCGYFVGLLVCTAPMHFVDSGNTHAFTLWSETFHPIRIPAMLLHTGAQLVFAMSFVGVALFAVASIRTFSVRVSGRLLLWGLLLIAVVVAPVLRHYSHFEAVIFSDGPWTIAWTSLLVVGVVSALIVRRDSSLETVALWTVALTFAGYAAAPIVLRFARADVSARIFAACIPILHAVIWRELAHHRAASRVLAVFATVLFAGFVIGSSWNATVFHRARIAVETQAKQKLADDLRMACPAFVNTNPVQLLTIEEIRLMGGDRLGDCAWIQTTTTNPESGMRLADLVAAGGIHADVGQDVYLFVQTARSRMAPELGGTLAGDFSWTQGLMPESDDDLFAGYQRMIYEVETDMEQLFMRQGLVVARASSSYSLLPLWWNEVPSRIRKGVPLIETYDYVASVYRIPARKPGYSPPGGRIRPDQSGR